MSEFLDNLQKIKSGVLKYVKTKGRKEVWRMEKDLDKDAVCHRSYSTYTVNTIPTNLLKDLGISK